MGLLDLIINTVAGVGHIKYQEQLRQDAVLSDMAKQAIQTGQPEFFRNPAVQKGLKRAWGEDYAPQGEWLANVHKKLMEESVIGQLVRPAIGGGAQPAAPAPAPAQGMFTPQSGVAPGTGMIAPEVLASLTNPNGPPTSTQPSSSTPQYGGGAPIASRPNPSIPATQAEPMTFDQREPTGDVSPVPSPTLPTRPRVQLPSGVSVTQKSPFREGESVTLTGATEAERRSEELRQFLATPQAGKMSTPELTEAARQRGVLTAPGAQEAIHAIGDTRFDAIVADKAKAFGRTMTDSEFRDASTQAMIETGHIPTKLAGQVFRTPEQQSMGYAQAMANAFKLHPEMSLDQIHNVVTSMPGLQPDANTVAQVGDAARNAMRARLMADSNLASNPAAMDAELLRRTGYLGASQQQIAAANAVAPLPPEVLQQYGIEGAAPPLARDLQRPVAGAGATKPVAGMVADLAAQRKATEAAGVTTATGEATALTKEKMRPEQTIPTNELGHFVNPTSLEVAQEGSKYKDVGPGGKYATFTGTPKDLNDLGRLRQVVDVYNSAMKKVMPLLEEGSVATRARALLITGGGGVKIPWTDITIGRIPAGALPDDTALALAFPGTDKATARKYAEGIVQMQAAEDTGLAILRTFFNEKGNVRGDLIQSGVRSLPTLSDNRLTATTKYKNLLDFADNWEKGYGMPGRAKWPAPRGD